MASTDDDTTLTAFTAGDLVISISGDGADTGDYTDNEASPITLEELTTAGAIVGELVLPQTTTVVDGTTEYAISGEYGSSSEGILQLSEDGESLVIGGYGVNAATYNEGGAAVYGNAALAQSTSIEGGEDTAVARVIADISYNTTIDTSTALYNVFNTNNDRSVATVDGTTFYVAGQGVSGDTTQGVFVADDGADTATAIYTGTDAREVEIVNGELYVSIDSKQGTDGTSEIANYGTELPVSATTAEVLPDIDGSVTLAAGQENGINDADVGETVNLSPESYFFANATTLYVADGGDPKEGGLGDGGLQKWTFNGTDWVLDYTLSDGLDLVADTATSGSTGLIGLTGEVVGGVVELYATNSTLGDLNQTYLYGITDTLSTTTEPTDESFTVLETAAADTNIRGVSFAPSAAATTPTATVVSSGVTNNTDLTVTSGGSVTVLGGGILVDATVESGGTAVISSGGIDSGTAIAHGATETVYGSATGDQIDGTQIVSSAGAGIGAVTSETVLNGGVVDLYIKSSTATDLTLTNGGVLNISGNATATNTTILSGGIIDMESAKAVVAGSLIFSGSGTLEETTTISAGYGVSAVISGFGVGDVVDLTTFGTATLTTVVSGGNTVATVTSGTASETFTFAGSVASSLSLITDGGTGMEIAYQAPAPVATVVSSGSTQSNLTVTSGSTLTVDAGGAVISTTVLSGGTAIISGSETHTVLSAGGNETLLGTATGDQIYGTQLISGATAVATSETVYNGGVVDLYLKGGIVSALTISSGGTLNISGNATAINTVVSNGGIIDLESPKANVTGTLTFVGSAILEETVVISAGQGVSAVISGFGTGDAIDLTAIATGATLTSSVVGGNTVETVTSGGTSEAFTFAGTYASGYFHLSSDTALGGVTITAAGTPCYCPGTLIETDQGEVAVEALRIGDGLVTRSGAVRPIRWIGHRAYSGRFVIGQTQILPILIRAGALADGLPRRDLMVSPLHAMFIDDVLIPASALVNGTSIIQMKAVESVEYFHLELDTHDVILAEGAPAETFVDDDSRAMFHNAADYDRLYPEALRQDARYCAPRVEDGAMLEAIRRRLAARVTPADERRRA
jgi:autotransporter passenger strand-loop-strand repeat protein